jgi:hypothetical protein
MDTTDRPIEIHLYGKLRRFAAHRDPAADSIVRLAAAPEETIGDVLDRIGIPRDEIGANVFLNGQYSDLSRPVQPGDRLGVFPDDMQLLYKWYFTKRTDR